ncbi:MAG: hypothetical protein RR565_08830 [Erysipelothrix sp.]
MFFCVIGILIASPIHAEEQEENKEEESKTGIKINSGRLNSKESVQGIKNQEKVFSKETQRNIEINKDQKINNTERMVDGLFSGNEPYKAEVIIFAKGNEYKKQEIRFESNNYQYLNYAIGLIVIVIGGYTLFKLIGGEEDGK